MEHAVEPELVAGVVGVVGVDIAIGAAVAEVPPSIVIL